MLKWLCGRTLHTGQNGNKLELSLFTLINDDGNNSNKNKFENS